MRAANCGPVGGGEHDMFEILRALPMILCNGVLHFFKSVDGERES